MLRCFLALATVGLAGLASAAPPVELRFSVWDGDKSLTVIKSILRQFERENPDIRVKLETYPDYALYHQKMLVGYAADVAPDVAMMDMGHFQALASRKAILPLNAFFAKTPGFDIKAYYKPIVDAMTYQGNLYVLPRDIAPEGILYCNKEAFKEAGIPFPDGTWTWDFKERPELKDKDFLWVMHKLTKPGPPGKPSVRFGYLAGWGGLAAESFAFGAGARYADNPEKVGKVTIDSPEWKQAYDLLNDLAKKRWMPSSTEVSAVLQQSSTALFLQQKVAMYQNGIWETPNIRAGNKPGTKGFFEYDIVQFPAYKDGSRGAPTGGSGYSVFTSTNHPDQAWRLTRYMSGPVAMKAMAAAGIAQPAIRSLALSPPWTVGPDTPIEQRYPPSREVLDKAVDSVVFAPTDELWPEVSGIFTSRTQGILDGNATPTAGLKQGQTEAQARLNSLRKEEKLPDFPWGLGIAACAVIVSLIGLCVYWPERRVRYTLKERKENWAAYRFLSPWLIGLAVFTLGPMVLSLLMAFLNWDMIRPAQWRGGGNFREMATEDPRFWVSLKVTLIYTLVATPLGILTGLGLALLLNAKFRGIPLFRAIYYIPSIASAVALTLVFRRIFSPDDGLINTLIYDSFLQKWFHLGDALSAMGADPGKRLNWLGEPSTALGAVIGMSLLGAGGAMVILLAGLQGIPQHYYEAATMDGAGPFRRLRNITLPLLTPSIFFTMITGFIGSFQVFTQIFVITGGANGGPDNSLLVFMIAVWSAAFTNLRMGYAASLGWVLFVVVLLFTLFQLALQKFVHYETDAR